MTHTLLVPPFPSVMPSNPVGTISHLTLHYWVNKQSDYSGSGRLKGNKCKRGKVRTTVIWVCFQHPLRHTQNTNRWIVERHCFSIPSTSFTEVLKKQNITVALLCIFLRGVMFIWLQGSFNRKWCYWHHIPEPGQDSLLWWRDRRYYSILIKCV